jgi:ankyrin repeat protein
MSRNDIHPPRRYRYFPCIDISWNKNVDGPEHYVDKVHFQSHIYTCSIALKLASRENHYDVARLLINRGANIEHQDDNGRTALLWASRYDCLDVAELLIHCGANIEHQDNVGRTVLLHASYHNRFGMIILLLDHDANIGHQDKDGYSLLMFLSQ